MVKTSSAPESPTCGFTGHSKDTSTSQSHAVPVILPGKTRVTTGNPLRFVTLLETDCATQQLFLLSIGSHFFVELYSQCTAFLISGGNPVQPKL